MYEHGQHGRTMWHDVPLVMCLTYIQVTLATMALQPTQCNQHHQHSTMHLRMEDNSMFNLVSNGRDHGTFTSRTGALRFAIQLGLVTYTIEGI